MCGGNLLYAKAAAAVYMCGNRNVNAARCV